MDFRSLLAPYSSKTIIWADNHFWCRKCPDVKWRQRHVNLKICSKILNIERIYLSRMREKKSLCWCGTRRVWSKGRMRVNKSVKGQNFFHSTTAIRARPELWTLLSARSACLWPTPPCFPPATVSEKPAERLWVGGTFNGMLSDRLFFFSCATEAVWESCCCWHMQRDSPLLLEARWHILCVSHASPNGCFMELSARPRCLRCASHSIFKKPVLHTETADKYVSDE